MPKEGYEVGCKCGAVHVAPMGSGMSDGFGLSFQDGTHTLYKKKKGQSRKLRRVRK